MTGLEKIVQEILDEAESAAGQTVSAAEKEAAGIEEEARKSSGQQAEEILRASKEAAGEILKRAQSSAELKKRQKILQAKQEMIRDLIGKAREELSKLPEESYFDVILKVAAKASLPQKGEMILSPEDRSRVPANFSTRLAEVAGKKGGSLTISEETRNLNGGCILIYGGVEENCSFDALFEAERERLTDRVNELLFR
ncbi:V-type ATP synthase subunit E [Caproiciproducens faecalis]|uniref:V-type proton ATPase subunit E n=1 Tax=Caproiciproducens faecalis TaxID=2820301 RepID=A0ABS7DMT7_9FIRM|nr:V-type ATP synthase subunit E family protein [Caproiciproducens faecalis]MBW7572105.1 hypothetical protein [Caproiciproducens faecalis]